MPANALVQARVDSAVKEEAAAVLATMEQFKDAMNPAD